MSRSFYRLWIELGPGLTDVLHDARIAACSDEDGLEVAGVHDPFHEHVLVRPFEIRRSSGDGNNDLPRRDICICIYIYIWIYICMYIYIYI